jgi:hypothetical protein
MNGEKMFLEMQSRFDGQLRWIVPELESLFRSQGGAISGQTLRIGLNSRYGSGYSACVIHGPIRDLDGQTKIPPNYRAILQRFNGAKLFAISLFGLLDDRSNQRRCLSLEHANKFWIAGYERLPSRSFHFGSRTFSYFENSGKILNLWASIEEMLRDEWKISKEIEAETKERLFQPRSAS